jgi:hypothetical protein
VDTFWLEKQYRDSHESRRKVRTARRRKKNKHILEENRTVYRSALTFLFNECRDYIGFSFKQEQGDGWIEENTAAKRRSKMGANLGGETTASV